MGKPKEKIRRCNQEGRKEEQKCGFYLPLYDACARRKAEGRCKHAGSYKLVPAKGDKQNGD